MSGAERRLHKGRPVVTRTALMREAMVDSSVAATWYGNRTHNGHPHPVLASGRSLYFDEATLIAWVRLQLDPAAAPPRIVRGGRNLVTRAELARLTGLSEAALRHIYANRAVTGHPEVVHRDRHALYFDENASLAWHQARLAGAERGRHPGRLQNAARRRARPPARTRSAGTELAHGLGQGNECA